MLLCKVTWAINQEVKASMTKKGRGKRREREREREREKKEKEGEYMSTLTVSIFFILQWVKKQISYPTSLSLTLWLFGS